MNVTWVTAEKLMETAASRLKSARIVLDIGCGICPQQMLQPLVHICCEPFPQYIEKLLEKTARLHDRDYIIVNASWQEAVKIFPAKSVDTVILNDVIEHLEKEEALQLLRQTEMIARSQIAIFTPLGFMPQVDDNGKDAWGMDGTVWQEHRSGWQPEDFGDSWEIIVAEQFHMVDSLLQKLDTPFGALWAIKTYDNKEAVNAASNRHRLHSLVDRIYTGACNIRDRLFLKPTVTKSYHD